MSLAASDAPAAVKGRAVEPVNKVKILPPYLLSLLKSQLSEKVDVCPGTLLLTSGKVNFFALKKKKHSFAPFTLTNLGSL
jgi:hypothetical protein